MPLATSEQTQFSQLAQVDEPYRGVMQMVTVYEKAGIKKGREEGRLEMLLLVLENRFATLPDHVRRKDQQIKSGERIEQILQAVLDGKSLSELGQ